MTMHPPLVDGTGSEIPPDIPVSMNLKRFLFDWSSVVAIVLATMTYATLTGDVRSNAREIERLRINNEERSKRDEVVAATMATRMDVQRVSDQVERLSSELRNARLAR